MEMHEISRPNDDLINQLRSLSPNDIGHHLHFGFSNADIKYMETAGDVFIVGPVLTVRIPPEDSVMVHKATELARPGDIIAVDMQGHTEHAPWGEMTTRGAMQSGAEAAIIDGSITDSRDIRELEFPVYARGRSARTTRLQGRGGDINVPIQIGSATVQPGNIAMANEDGILFIPPEKAETAVKIGMEAVNTEEETREQIESGKPIPEITAANDLIENMGDD